MRMLTSTTLAAAALVATALTAPGPAATATSTSGAWGTAPLVEGTGRALVQGVVVDQLGRAVDDVTVTAETLDGEVVASDLSYASPDNDNPHGYFALRVTRGSYVVTFSKPGYTTAATTVERDRRERAGLGRLELVKQPVLSKVAVEAPRRVRTTEPVVVGVRVTSTRDAARPTGAVVVSEGRRVLGRTVLDERDRGRATLRVGRLARGSHTLTVAYRGNAVLKASQGSSTVVVTQGGRG